MDFMDTLFPELAATAVLDTPEASPAQTEAPAPRAGRARNPKLFYKINEVAQLTGLKPHVLRYWETEFRELSPAKDASDQRRYRKADIEVVQTIRKLLYEERFTIEGARKRLRIELSRARETAGKGNGKAASKASGAAAQRIPATTAAQPPRTSAARREQAGSLNGSLKRLRSEVNELLKILGA
jgi:DNA-binding transcriptional MerR regulator